MNNRSRPSGSWRPPREGIVPNPKLKLADQCREVLRYRHLSLRTEEAGRIGWWPWWSRCG